LAWMRWAVNARDCRMRATGCIHPGNPRAGSP